MVEVVWSVGDGEVREGQIWEAISMKDDNVIVHMDRNMFGLATTLTVKGGDKMVVYHQTIKGSGISFMEGNNRYHAGALSEDEYNRAVQEICNRSMQFAIREVEKVPYTRPCKPNYLLKAYAEIIAEIGRNESVVVMDADLAPDCGLVDFGKAYPDRFIQCGIAEQDMVSMATGLSAGGFIPIVHSFAVFLCRRANEQIYNACLERRHIVFVGHFAGLIPCGPGTSHECMEDIALMKTMPGMTILEPRTKDDLRSAMEWAVNEATGPVYVSVACWEMEVMRR